MTIEGFPMEIPVPPSLDEVLAEFTAKYGFVGSPREQDMLRDLKAGLVAREDMIADLLRLAGVQFQLFPQIVAKVLMDAAIGTPPTEDMRKHIDSQFADLLQHLRDEHGFGPPM